MPSSPKSPLRPSVVVTYFAVSAIARTLFHIIPSLWPWIHHPAHALLVGGSSALIWGLGDHALQHLQYSRFHRRVLFHDPASVRVPDRPHH